MRCVPEIKMTRLSPCSCVVFALALCAVAVSRAHAAVAEADKATIDQMLQASLDQYHVASVTAEVRQNGEVIYSNSLGYADLEWGVRPTPEALYAIGSITKSITSFVVLNLVHQGKLRLNSRLGDVLPKYQGPAEEVTILQLLTHTSGIPDYAGDGGPPLWGDPRREFTEQQVVDLFKDKPLNFKPGSHWQYSNSGYYMLSRVIEQVTGKSYGEAVQEVLLGPFGLSHIVLGRRTAVIGKRVMGYTINAHGQVENALTSPMVVALGAGAYLASADDLTRYVADLFSAAVPAAVHQMMFRRVSLLDGTEVNYLPAALEESNFYGHEQFSHGGGYFGFHAYVVYYPDQKVAIAVLTNTDSVESQAGNLPIGRIAGKIAHVILNIPQPSVEDVPLSRSEAKAYVGNYRMREFMSSDRVRFFYEKNSLWMKVGTDARAIWYALPQNNVKKQEKETTGAVQLLYQGHGRFVEKGDHESQVEFISGGSDHLDVRLGAWHTGKFAGQASPAT